MKIGKCEKCGRRGFINIHHILPLSAFGKNDETENLCPNCHADYHEYLGSDGLKNKDIGFHFEKFFKWLFMCFIVGLLYFLFK